MNLRRSFAPTVLVLLFFLEGQRVFFSSLFALVYEALFPVVRPLGLAGAVLPLAALAAPLLPVSWWLGRRGAVAAAVALAAAARVALSVPAFPARLLASTLIVAGGAIFIVAAVGYLDRRSLAAGAVGAVVLDQLLRLAGWSYDLTLQPRWLPVQVAVSALAVVVLTGWLRAPAEADETRDPGLERRAGGLRLRGAVALGVILFFETNVLALPAVAARWTGVAYPAMAVLLVAAGTGAMVLVLGAREPVGRHRPAAVVLAALATAAAVVPWVADGWGPALLIAAGHAAALLLLGRALTPAGGRRGGWTAVVGFAVFVALTILYALTFFSAFTLPALQGGAPWVLLVGGLVLGTAVLLIPRPGASPPPAHGPSLLGLAAAGTVAAAALLAWDGARVAAPGQLGPEAAAGGGTIRVATYNAHYGFDEGWRYNPEEIARVLEASGADVAVLQEVPAGLAAAYGTDLALWLGRRLGMRAHFAPSINGLLGDAVLTRLPAQGFAAALLPAVAGDRKQVARLDVLAGGDTLHIFGTHLGLTPAEQEAQTAAALAWIGAGRAVLAGDLNAGPGSHVARRLEAAGFRDAFDLAGAPSAPTAPARAPRERIDWIWIRGYVAVGARVLSAAPSDHRLVVATLRLGVNP